MLVNGTKEKNSAVKATSETALVALLHLRGSDDSVQSEALQILDAGARDALNDVIVKVLKIIERLEFLISQINVINFKLRFCVALPTNLRARKKQLMTHCWFEGIFSTNQNTRCYSDFQINLPIHF